MGTYNAHKRNISQGYWNGGINSTWPTHIGKERFFSLESGFKQNEIKITFMLKMNTLKALGMTCGVYSLKFNSEKP